MNDKKILILRVGHDDGTTLSYYGIEHEGYLWLVTEWLINRLTGKAKPIRMIRVDEFQASDSDQFDYVNILLPKAVIHGVGPNKSQYTARNLPDSPVVDFCDLKILP